MKKILCTLMALFALTVGVKAQTTFYVENYEDGWAQLAMYNWKDGVGTDIYGDWPGVLLWDGTTCNPNENPNVIVSKDGVKFTITIPDGVGFANLILNNNNGGKQIDLDAAPAGKTYIIGTKPLEGTKFYIDNYLYGQLALYSYGPGEDLGGWPGTVLWDGANLNPSSSEKISVSKEGNRFTVTVASTVTDVNFIVNNNNGGMQMDLADFAADKVYTLKPAAYSQNIYFINDGWGAVALYNYGGSGEIYGGWPGVLLVNGEGALNPNGELRVEVTKFGMTTADVPVYKIGLGDDTGFENLIFNNNNNASQFNVDYENGAYYNTIGKTTDPTMASYTVTTAKEYTTYVTPGAMNFAGLELKAYKAASVGDSKVTMEAVNNAPAGTPLVLKGTVGGSYTVPVAAETDAIGTNLLVAGDGTTVIGGDTRFDYGLVDDKFHRLAEGTVAVGKAYLHLDSAPSAHELEIEFKDGGATGITSVQDSGFRVQGSNAVYDLQGRRVAQPAKGLYIVNGKKVLVR